jgi:uncharacterized sulfatase
MKQVKVNGLSWGFFLFVLIFALSCKSNSKSAEIQRPNLIFYLADDQNIQDYGCYGNDKVLTPAVDRLAKEGILFENAFTAQAICAPSRSQIYTGNYPLKNGCFLNHSNTKPDMISVTKYLGDLGYEVILAGKSHVKPANVYNWDRVWDPVKVEGMPRDYIPLDSIKAYFEKADKPFCMFITSEFPHGEYFDVPAKSVDNYKFFPYDEKKKNDPAYLKKVAGYYRSIEEDNSQLETVLGWVDEYLDDNTLFIYSADHGVNGKFTVYDRGLNVPFVVRWPGVIKPGTKSDVLIHYTDVLPTFIEIAGGNAVPEMDGKSFLPVLKGGKEEIHEYVYGVQTNQNIMHASVFPSRMIRSKKYKYIRNFNSVEVVEQNLGENKNVNAFIEMGAMKFKNIPFEELYDMEADPFEQNNLAKNPDYLELKEKLAAEMFAWMKQQGDILNETPGNMPLIKPRSFALDREESFREVPDSLENTLTDKDYLILDYLMK